MIYTITFNPALDYIVRLDHLTPGSINRTEQEYVLGGGKGINVSIVLQVTKSCVSSMNLISVKVSSASKKV